MPNQAGNLSDRELLIQIAERVRQVREDILVLRAGATTAATKVDLVKLERHVDSLMDNFVTKEEFEPIKRIVYGVVGLILVAVVGGIVGLVVTGGAP